MSNFDYTTDLKNGKIDRGNFDANIQFLEETGLLKKDLRILEIGCGAGRLTNHLIRKGFDAIGFDISEALINEGHSRYLDVRRVLKSGGFYLFQTPNKLTNVPFEIIKNRSLTKHSAYHCSLQTFWSLKRLLVAHSFEFRFVKIPVMNEFMERKIKNGFGRAGVGLSRVVNPDRLPLPMRTNFYAISTRI